MTSGMESPRLDSTALTRLLEHMVHVFLKFLTPFANPLDPEFVQGHSWKGCVLEAWLVRKNKGDHEEILGPVDHITGRLRPAPTPRRLTRLPMTPVRGNYRSPFNSHSIASSYGSSGDSTNSMSSEGVPLSINTTSSTQQRQRVQKFPSTSSSSRNGSISSSSTTLSRDAYTAVSTFHTTPNTLGFPLASAYTNVSKRPAVGYASLINAQRSTPPSSISENASQAFPTTSAPTRYYKVTIRNLSLEATKERVGELIEQKTRIYVPLVQPHPIKLQPHKGQIHAYVKFTRKDDAEKAVRGIRGLRFLGRPLQAILEVVAEQ